MNQITRALLAIMVFVMSSSIAFTKENAHPSDWKRYIVQQGDTYWKICKDHADRHELLPGYGLDKCMKGSESENGVSAAKLNEGRVIYIPARDVPVVQTAPIKETQIPPQTLPPMSEEKRLMIGLQDQISDLSQQLKALQEEVIALKKGSVKSPSSANSNEGQLSPRIGKMEETIAGVQKQLTTIASRLEVIASQPGRGESTKASDKLIQYLLGLFLIGTVAGVYLLSRSNSSEKSTSNRRRGLEMPSNLVDELMLLPRMKFMVRAIFIDGRQIYLHFTKTDQDLIVITGIQKLTTHIPPENVEGAIRKAYKQKRIVGITYRPVAEPQVASVSA